MEDSVVLSHIRDMVEGRPVVLGRTGEDISRGLGIFKQNELLCGLLVSGGNIIPDQARLKEEQGRAISVFHKDMADAARTLDSLRLRYFMMKSVRSYPYTDDDIDLVCAEKDFFGRYADALRSIGYEFKWNRSMLREPGKYFFVKRPGAGPVIHLHRAVTWNGIEFLDAGTAWERSKTVNINGYPVRVPSVEDEMLILAAHTFHENTYLTAGELLHIKGLRDSLKGRDMNMDYMLAMSERYNWKKAFESYIRIEDAYYRELIAPGRGKRLPPYFIPAASLIPAYVSKVLRDILSLKIFRVPREVFTFCVVIWLFRMKKAAKFNAKGKR
jgi:hypothetical protein